MDYGEHSGQEVSVRPTAEDRRFALLRRLVAADDAASDQFITVSADHGQTIVFHDGFPGHQTECDMGDLKALLSDGFLTVAEWKQFGDMVFALPSKAHQLVRARDQALTDWGPATAGDIEDRLEGLREELVNASSLDDYQDVGRRTREILIELARNVFDASMVPSGEETPGISDTKRMLDYFFEARLPGNANAVMRALMRAADKLANTETHSSDASAVHAYAVAQAGVLIMRVAQMLKGDND